MTRDDENKIEKILDFGPGESKTTIYTQEILWPLIAIVCWREKSFFVSQPNTGLGIWIFYLP